MTKFAYRNTIVDGEAAALPELEDHIEGLIPDHRDMFHRILTDFGFVDWEVIFQPSRNLFSGNAIIAKPLKLIVIANHLDKKEIIVSFYHEVIHGLYPLHEDPSEERIEAQANQWYEEDYYKIK